MHEGGGAYPQRVPRPGPPKDDRAHSRQGRRFRRRRAGRGMVGAGVPPKDRKGSLALPLAAGRGRLLAQGRALGGHRRRRCSARARRDRAFEDPPWLRRSTSGALADRAAATPLRATWRLSRQSFRRAALTHRHAVSSHGPASGNSAFKAKLTAAPHAEGRQQERWPYTVTLTDLRGTARRKSRRDRRPARHRAPSSSS